MLSNRDASVMACVEHAVSLALETGHSFFIWDDQGAIHISEGEPLMDDVEILARISPA